MHGVRQSTATPYNPCMATLNANRFNRTLFGLMRTLNSEQKPNWPVYLPSLVYAYNATPHSSTGFQPYELMFGCKAPMPCDNWLGLDNYKPESFKSKTVWLKSTIECHVACKQAGIEADKKVHSNIIRTTPAAKN